MYVAFIVYLHPSIPHSPSSLTLLDLLQMQVILLSSSLQAASHSLLLPLPLLFAASHRHCLVLPIHQHPRGSVLLPRFCQLEYLSETARLALVLILTVEISAAAAAAVQNQYFHLRTATVAVIGIVG